MRYTNCGREHEFEDVLIRGRDQEHNIEYTAIQSEFIVLSPGRNANSDP